MEYQLFNPKYENKLIRKASIKYILPLLAGMLFSQTSPLVDALCLSRTIDETAMSALGNVGAVFYAFNIIGCLLGIGCGVTISKASGSGDKDSAARVFSFSLLMLAAISILMSVLGIVFQEQILNLLSVTEQNYIYAKKYYMIIVSGAIFIVFNFAGDYILINDNNPNLAFAGDATGAIVNIVVDIVGVFYFGMGISIVAIGTVFGSFCACLVDLFHFRKKDRLCRIRWPKLKETDPGIIAIIRPGVAEALLYVMFVIQMIVQNKVLVAEAGTSGLGNATIIDNIEVVLNMIITSITGPVATFASAYYGEENGYGLNLVKKIFLSIGNMMMIPVSLLCFAFPEAIIYIYKIKDPMMLKSLPAAIRLEILALLVSFVAFVFVEYLSAIEEDQKADIAIVINGVMGIVMTIILEGPCSYNAPWFAKLIAAIIVLIYLLIFCRHLTRGLIKSHKENIILLDGGELSRQTFEKWVEDSKKILGEDETESMYSKMLLPVLKALPGDQHPLASFTILERKDKKLEVILRYDSSKNYLEGSLSDSNIEDENKEIIDSEFLKMQRIMMTV